jgi:hypothetical protein
MTLLRPDPGCIRVCPAEVTGNEGYLAWTQAAQSLTVDLHPSRLIRHGATYHPVAVAALAAIDMLLIGMAQP